MKALRGPRILPRLGNPPTTKVTMGPSLYTSPMPGYLFLTDCYHQQISLTGQEIFLKSGASTFLDDDSGMSPVSIPDHCGTKRTSHSQCSDFPSFSSPGEKGKEKEELGKKKIDHEGALETERGGCKKKKSGTKRITPVIDTQVRRSERVRLGSAGFKYNGCTSKKCSSCNPPP